MLSCLLSSICYDVYTVTFARFYKLQYSTLVRHYISKRKNKMISIYNIFFYATVLVLVEQVSCNDRMPDGPTVPITYTISSRIVGQFIIVHCDGNVTATGRRSGRDLSIQPSIISKHA